MQYILGVPHLLLGLKTADLCFSVPRFHVFLYVTFFFSSCHFSLSPCASLLPTFSSSSFSRVTAIHLTSSTLFLSWLPQRMRERVPAHGGRHPARLPSVRKGVCVCVCLCVTEVVQMLLQSLRPACCICKMTNHTYHLGGIIKKLWSLRRVFEREAAVFIHPQGGFQVQPVFAYISERSII